LLPFRGVAREYADDVIDAARDATRLVRGRRHAGAHSAENEVCELRRKLRHGAGLERFGYPATEKRFFVSVWMLGVIRTFETLKPMLVRSVRPSDPRYERHLGLFCQNNRLSCKISPYLYGL